jgi:hypothetical protein
VKKSGRDESIWVETHICMETTQGISLHSYLYLKPAKTLCFSYYFLCFLFNKIREQNRTGSAQKQGGGEVAQIMYTHVSKCKNNKIKTKIIVGRRERIQRVTEGVELYHSWNASRNPFEH